MTTNFEALRAQFEKLLSDSGRACLYEGDGQYAYPHDFAWICFQAGHAAAKAETADVGEPVAHALVFSDGGKDFMQWPVCSDEQDARRELQMYADAVRRAIRIAPLYTADQLAAAVAAERERCLRIVESVDNYSNPMTANDCADAIRAGAKEPSDADKT